MEYGSLASTHYNTGLRCAKDGMHSPGGGDLKEVVKNDETFADEVEHGHTWLVLPDTIPEPALRQVSKWYNQDQNKNKTMDEVEIIRMIMDILDEYLDKFHGKQTIQLGQLTAMLSQRIPLQMPATVLSHFCRWTLDMIQANAKTYLDKYLEWHSCTVNPKGQSVPQSLFEALSKNKTLSKYPGANVFLVLTDYTDEGKHVKV